MRVFVIIAVSVMTIFLLSGLVTAYLESHGVNTNPEGSSLAETVTKIVAFALFLLLGFSMVPIFLRLFIRGQTKIGNGDLWPIKLLRENEVRARVAIWLVFALGFLMALPAMIADGFFE
ncbi:MAG: hypothetical protein HY706_16135 [Candidatus Hydrogenedentes bacterium]|nr:hypothetical protein [Candidatus Hydrogenedentota bacterium]